MKKETGYSVTQKFSITTRKPIKHKWEIRKLSNRRLIHVSKTYSGAVSFIRRSSRKKRK